MAPSPCQAAPLHPSRQQHLPLCPPTAHTHTHTFPPPPTLCRPPTVCNTRSALPRGAGLTLVVTIQRQSIPSLTQAPSWQRSVEHQIFRGSGLLLAPFQMLLGSLGLAWRKGRWCLGVPPLTTLWCCLRVQELTFERGGGRLLQCERAKKAACVKGEKEGEGGGREREACGEWRGGK